jgi:hypothetical protein
LPTSIQGPSDLTISSINEVSKQKHSGNLLRVTSKLLNSLLHLFGNLTVALHSPFDVAVFLRKWEFLLLPE